MSEFEVKDDAELEVDAMEVTFSVDNQIDKAADSGAISSQNQDSEMEVSTLCFPPTLASLTILSFILTKLISDLR